MNREDIVIILQNIADLLEIKGENYFKIRAYRMAAESIAELPDDRLNKMNQEDLEKLPHVGSAIAKKISEYRETGSIGSYEILKKELPIELLQFLEIPSLGPKKIATIYKHLGITTIVDLQDAAEKGKLQDLEGFGKITEMNILRGIRFTQKTQGRALLVHADETAQRYLQHLSSSPAVESCHIAGSLRRMKETIGDIDILITSNEPDTVMNHFVSYPEVNQVVAKGQTKTTVLLHNHIQVDLRVVQKESMGAALQYFTGSKEHNVALRALALKKGYKLNEYGLFKKKNEQYISGASEEDIYKQIGLEYIPPEIRENRGEIEAAENHHLPTLIQQKDIQGDLHVHSTWSDGLHSIQEIIQQVESMNYAYVGITDHSQSLRIAKGLLPYQVEQKINEIQSINTETKIQVLCGTECDIHKDGTLDYPNHILDLFDYVIIGIHMGFSMNKNEATNRILKAMEHPSVTLLAHPTCRMIGHREPLPLDMTAVFEKAVDTNTALEINSFPDRLDLSDYYVKQAKEYGVRFFIDTDAHAPHHLHYMKYGVATARRGWLEQKDVINTFPPNMLKQYLSS